MKVAILGVGTVGEAVANCLIKNHKIITARAGVSIEPVIGVVRDLKKTRDTKIPLTDDLQGVINRDDIDVYVELMGGVELPFKVVSTILGRKKAVVTANKALLAYHRYDLQNIAKDTPFGYEASVAGGIPIIKSMREGLSANHINSITGILNGTSNYILSSMMNDGDDFSTVLARAKELGYAESDPTFDIGGFDAAHKLLILSSIAYGINACPEDILIEGIENISSEDIFFAKEFEYQIKLLAIARKISNKIELRVHPTLVPNSKMIAKVNGVMNAISVVGDTVGETMYYGAGAGGNATASAVISDLIDIARGLKSPMLGYKSPIELEKLKLIKPSDISSKYYFRLKVRDEAGVLAKIATLMGKHNLSADAFLQRPVQDLSERLATMFFVTHFSLESDARAFVSALSCEDFIRGDVFMMRIEE